MNYDFFADKADKSEILEFIVKETDLLVYDLSSPYGEETGQKAPAGNTGFVSGA